jgi:hypothetical protein
MGSRTGPNFKKVIRALAAGNRTDSQVARAVGISRQRVHQIRLEAKKLKIRLPAPGTIKPPKAVIVQRACHHCGKLYRPGEKEQRYCCRACGRFWSAGARWSIKGFVTLTCDNCRRTFQRTRYQESMTLLYQPHRKNVFCGRMFCGRRCRISFMRRKTAVGH